LQQVYTMMHGQKIIKLHHMVGRITEVTATTALFVSKVSLKQCEVNVRLSQMSIGRWDVMPCSLVDRYQWVSEHTASVFGVEEILLLYKDGGIGFFWKDWYLSTKLYIIICQKSNLNVYRSRCGTIPIFNIIHLGKCGNQVRYKLDTNPLLFHVILHHLRKRKLFVFQALRILTPKIDCPKKTHKCLRTQKSWL
jgi:hypothetical protein